MRPKRKPLEGKKGKRAEPVPNFVIAPLNFESRRNIEIKKPQYEEVKKVIRQMKDFRHGNADFFGFLEHLGVGQKRKYGFVLDVLKLQDLAFFHPDAETRKFFSIFFGCYSAFNPGNQRAAQLESIGLIKQLRELGFRIGVQDAGEKEKAVFVRAARIAGAQVVKGSHNQMLPVGMVWARDQWVKIGGAKEKPKTDFISMMRGLEHIFGEGGNMVQLGPKEFAISEQMAKDPRIKKYEARGYKFQIMPNGTVFDKVMSDLFGTKIYTFPTHLDFSIGAIPELKISAVCPYYYGDHKMSVQLMERNFGLTLVEVPKEEADRHPANFLALGSGRVLVDSGAPRFIHELERAGAVVIPTAVPLDYLLENKGGLHCLFNEY